MSSLKQGSELSVEELYIKEKKKNQILMVSTIVLVIALISSFAFNNGGFSESTATTTPTFGQNPTGGGRGTSLASFFSSDGSVNQQAIDDLYERSESRGLDPSLIVERIESQIADSQASGEMTEAQATELKIALEQ